MDDPMHRIDKHEDICAERYKAIFEQLATMARRQASDQQQLHERLNAISNRMWAMTVGTLGGAVAALAALLFFLLTTRWPH